MLSFALSVARHTPLLAAALYLICQTPSAEAAYAYADADATLMLAGTPTTALGLDAASSEEESTAAAGDSVVQANASQFTLPRALMLLSSTSADALFPPAGTASASAWNSGTWTLSNLNTESALEVDLLFDWFYVVDSGSDAVAPQESALATVRIALSVLGEEDTLLFERSAGSAIGDGELTDQDMFGFSLALAPGETRVLRFEVETSASARVVPLPAPLALLAAPLFFFARHRRPSA